MSNVASTLKNYALPGAAIGTVLGASNKKHKNTKERIIGGAKGAVGDGVIGGAYGHVFKSIGDDTIGTALSHGGSKKHRAKAIAARAAELGNKNDKATRGMVDKKDQHRLPWAKLTPGKFKAAMMSGFSDELIKILSR